MATLEGLKALIEKEKDPTVAAIGKIRDRQHKEKVKNMMAARSPEFATSSESSTPTDADINERDMRVRENYEAKQKEKVREATATVARTKRSNGLTTKEQREEAKEAQSVINTERKKDAKKNSISPVRALQGGMYLFERAATGAGGAIENVFKFTEGYTDYALSKVTGALGMNKVSETLKKTSQDALERGTFAEKSKAEADEAYKPSETLKYAGDLFESGGRLALPMLAEAATVGMSPWLEAELAVSGLKLAGTSGALKTAAKGIKALSKTKAGKIVANMWKPSSVLFRADVTGSAASEAYRETGDIDKAVSYGYFTGLAESLTEQIFGGFAGTDIGTSLIDFKIGNTALRKTANILSEAVEEIMTAAADPGIKRMTGVDKDAKMPGFVEFAQAGAGGILLSALMGVATAKVGSKERTKAINSINTVTDGINKAIEGTGVKITPLSKYASVTEIEKRQQDIENFAKNYAKAGFAEMLEFGYIAEEKAQQSENSSKAKQSADIVTDTTSPIEASANSIEKKSSGVNYTDKTFEAEHAELKNTELPSVLVGDTFTDTELGNTITVVERDNENTTIRIDSETKSKTETLKNRQADMFIVDERYKQIESGKTADSSASNQNTAEMVTSDENTVSNSDVTTTNGNSEAVDVQKAQKYNIVVSNLKRKADELGLMDRSFQVALQNVHAFNPTAEDKALISREFNRIFAGNTDPLVANWLDSINAEVQPVTSINEQNMHVNTENNPVNDAETDVQLIEDYNGAVEEIMTADDETARKYAEKRAAVEVLANTPTVILDNVEGAKDLKVIINYSKLYLAVRKDGIFKGHYHNLGADIAKRLPEFLEKPDAIIQLDNGRINMFTTVETQRGNNGIISVELNSTKDIDGKYEDYNVVITMFSSDDKYVQNLLSGDGVNVRYKRKDLSQVNPQLYKWLAIINDKSSIDNIVPQDNDIVNNKDMHKYEKNANDYKSRIRNAVEKSLYPQFKEDSTKGLIEKQFGDLTDYVINEYQKNGDIGDLAKTLFADNGEAVTQAVIDENSRNREVGENIDERTFDSVGSRNVKAYQYLYPQLKKYYRDTARQLITELHDTVKGERFSVSDSENSRQFSGTKRIASESIARIKDSTDASYANIEDALNRIINDNGQENVALAKRIELVIDDMLSEGYTAFDGTKVPADMNYIAEKEKITVSKNTERESGIKKAESITETPENKKITVGMSDEARAELLNKKSVEVVSFDAENTKALDNIDLDALQNSYPSYARPIIKKIARDFGIVNEPFFNPDIELEFSYSGDSIQESINKQHSRYGDFVKMLSVFSDVIENAVGVETHKDKYTGTRREDTNLKQMYVLASAFSDEKGVYPVKLEVKEFKKNTNKLYLSVVLTKKESRYLSGNLGQDQLNTAPPTSVISISDLVGIVNPSEGDFLKYFPDSMLDNEQIESKNKALAKDAEKIEKLSEDKKRSLATAESADALSSTPETTNSTAFTDTVSQESDTVNSYVRNDTKSNAEPQQKDSTPSAYDVAYFDDLSASIRKGESVSLKDVRTAVDAILLNHGEAIKAELSQLKNDELKKHLSIYDRGRITKKAEMVDAIYTDMLSNLYYALSGKETITYIYDGTGFEAQQSKMLFDVSRELTEESFNKRLEENAEKYKKQLAAREEKLSKVKNPQTLEDYAYKKRYFGLSDEETIQYENLYAEERRKTREKKKAAKTTKDTSGADAFFANTDNYTIEKTTHTKTGEDVWVVRPASRLETEQWKQLNEQMKALGGSYWRGNQGWNFKKDPTAALSSAEETETETVKGSTNAEKLRAVAEGMQKAIDDKFRDRLTNTAKRAREAASAEAEGERLKRLQDTINNIADALENGKNTLLDKIDSKAQVETLMSMLSTGRRNRISETLPDITYDERLQEQDKPYSNDDAKYAEYPLTKLHESAITEYIRAAEGKTGYKQITDRLKRSLKSVKNGYVTVDAQMFANIDKIVQNLSTYRADFWNDGVSERKRLARMGIENVVELRAYLREFIKFLPGKDADAERQRNIKAKERQLANAKIEGFFPTPKAIVDKMLDEADIQPGEKVLEPSAGKGNIADAIRENYPDNALDVVEWNASLNELLSEKRHNVVGVDFLQHSDDYDKIIMNPPFEKGQDIDHIKHAYSLLNDGGRVVCIMSEGAFFRSDKKATEFRKWLDSLGGVSEKLPDGAFKTSERSTGVNTRLVVIDKVASDTKSTKSKSGVKSSREVEASDNQNEYKGFVSKLKSRTKEISEQRKVFSVDESSIAKSEKPSQTIINYFNAIGNKVESPILGEVELNNRGAKTTTFHGISDEKLIAIAAVKDVIENGTVIDVQINWKNRGYNTYILAAHGEIKKADSIVGVVIKNYPQGKMRNKFYLHEVIKIGVNSDAAAIEGVTDVIELTPSDITLSQNKENVNTNDMQLPKKHSYKEENTAIEGNNDVVRSSRNFATESSKADRWATGENAGNKTKVDKAKEKMVGVANKAIEKVNETFNVNISNVEKDVINISEIIEQISSEFGIPISTGKVTDREASGIYKEKPETIRTRVSNNLPTISHELGHHLDKKYNLNELSSVESIRKIVSKEFLDQYPDDAINSELVAEFVRRYLKNSNEANRLCPEFYNDFVRTLSKEDLAAVNRVAKQINEYLSYDIDKRYESSVISDKKAKKMQKLPFVEKWKNLYTGWIDKFHPLKQITDYVSEVKGSVLSGTKNAYVLATNSLNAHTIANYQVLEGFRDLNGNFVDDAKSLIDCIGMVNSKDISTLDLYLKLKHALEVIGKGKRAFADEILENPDNIKRKIAEIEKAHPEMVEAANNLYEFQYNMLKHFAVPSGIMTMEQVEHLHHEYPCYVPFYRFIKNKKGGMFAKSSFVNQSSPIMRQTGSGLDTLSHLESIIRNVEKVIKASVRNQTAAVLGSYADNVDGIGQFIEKVAPDMLPHTIDITALKENFVNRLQEVVKSGDDFFAISGLMDEVFGDDVTDFTPIENESKKIISVMRGGERSYYQIHDDTLFSAVAELSPQQANGWIRICNNIMQPMKLLITQNNPIFAATNALRDFGTAYKLSQINNIVTFTTQYVNALGGIIANSEDYKKYKAMGGGHSSELSANIENISKTLRRVAQKDMGKARRLAYSIFRHPVDSVASINDAIESIPRFMEFERTLKENGDLQKAIFNASDITTNFKRSGSSNTAKFVNSSIMFNNAAIQGLDKTFRTLTAKDPKKRYGTLLKWLLHALIMGILGYLYNKEVDEEGYKNLSSYKKNNFYNFAIGDGKFISLPKPRENALLDTVTERTIEYLFGDNEEAFYDFGSYLCSQLLPPMIPDTLHPVDAVHSVGGSTIFGGLLDVGFNKDFKGTSIEGAYDKYTPSNERYTENTTMLAYGLGQTKLARNLDMSPKKIDHLISSYTGILGQVNKALFPMNENRKDTSFGLRNKFVSDSNYSTDVLNRMYENQEKAEKAFNYSGSVRDAVEYEKNSMITSYISGMNKAVKALPEDEQRNGRAYLLKALNSWNYEDTASQSKMLNSLADSTISKDAIFTELPGSTLEWTENKQKYVYQMTPQEYHKYISDYLTVIENMRKLHGGNTVESHETAKDAAKDYMSDYKNNIIQEQKLRKMTAKSE